MRLEPDLSLGEFGDVRLNKGGRRFSGACFAHAVSACSKMAQGDWAAEHAVLAAYKQSSRSRSSDLIEGWSKQTRTAVSGRHVLAIQDTSEIQFSTTPGHRRGLGKIGKGNAHGVLLHAMIAVDADSGSCLGLVGGQVWTRQGTVETPHGERALADKESARWLTTAEQGNDVLAEADMITVIDDREGDFYAHWALTPDDNVHHPYRGPCTTRRWSTAARSTRQSSGRPFATRR